ncbi:zinc finger protein-like 1 [Gouania willdenowi]|uniref:Zinc finger protein-like 1 n=1 Tax=Gouania willdenowi TaxID=441366 RepID=A0A8C5G4W1_GOUWI|nr:zinc finger protein-like 1 [Gouania willdenowi]XP_028322408.1 zinc finger protein-like 1 [Gouania willdenowi]
MGLCKCPKRKVTNLFCFEHRVNVCEHCLVSNHNKCIVQSYLQWLQDSDYNPNCALCNSPLSAHETVRLACYDVFHWSCLNDLAARLPLHTAPAGYQCPTCQGPVFPPTNLASPVADVLKEQLSSVNWARAGLGLPLIEDLSQTTDVDTTDYRDWSIIEAKEQSQVFSSHAYNSSSDASQSSASAATQDNYSAPQNNWNQNVQEHTVVNITNSTTPTSTSTSTSDTITIHTASSPRKIYGTGDVAHSSVTQIDFDDDKYRRRPALSWFARILKNRTGGKIKSLPWKQRLFVLFLVGVLGFFTLIIIMAKLGRASASSDPNLDPLMNPNIRVGKN